jgi:hypothetical protein
VAEMAQPICTGRPDSRLGKEAAGPHSPGRTGPLTRAASEKIVVPQARLERAHPCEYQILSLARLPVPPLGPLRGGGT